MKKNKLIYTLCMVCASLFIFQGCSDDSSGGNGAGVQFSQVAATYFEADGTGTILIPIRGGSVSNVELQFDGTATEGEDFEVVSLTKDGLSIQVIDDNNFENNESVRVRLVGNNVGGNAFFTLNIISNCEDTEGFSFAGDYTVVTDDWADFSVNDILTVETVDATHIRVVEYPATAFSHAPMIITITNLITGAATVVSQDNGSYNASGTQQTTTSGSGSVTPCDGIQLTLDFALPCCGSFNDNVLVLKKI